MSQDDLAFHRRTRHLRYVTSQLAWGFPGLTRTPIGLLFLLPDLNDLVQRKLRLPHSIWIYILPPLVVGVSCLLASHDLRRYYARRFGRILSDGRKTSVMDWLRLLWLPALVILYIFFASRSMPPFYGPGLLLALYYLNSWRNSDGPRVHRAMAAGLVALLSLLPFWGIISMTATVELAKRLFALELIFGGLADHVLLVRSFRAQSAEIHEHTVPRTC